VTGIIGWTGANEDGYFLEDLSTFTAGDDLRHGLQPNAEISMEPERFGYWKADDRVGFAYRFAFMGFSDYDVLPKLGMSFCHVPSSTQFCIADAGNE